MHTLLDVRGDVMHTRRQPIKPHSGMLDEMVVDGHDLMVILQGHGASVNRGCTAPRGTL